MKYRYRLNGPLFSDAAVESAASLLREPEEFGTVVNRFEEEFCRRFGLDWCTAVSNATAAYQMILVHLGLKPGDKIIVPAYTFVSAANIPVINGVMPVFCDSMEGSPAPSLDDIRQKTDDRVKALLYVSTLGYSKGMEEAYEFCRSRGIIFIHDAASSLGTRVNGKETALTGDYVFTSLHYKKILSSFEGGVLWGRDGEQFFSSYRNHGKIKDFDYPGMNYRISDLHAVIGLRQLETLDQRIKKRRVLYDAYVEGLANSAATPVAYAGEISPAVHQMMVSSPERDGLMKYLASRGVETGYPAQYIPGLPAFRDREDGTLPHARGFSSTAFSLPFHEKLNTDDIWEICSIVRGFSL